MDYEKLCITILFLLGFHTCMPFEHQLGRKNYDGLQSSFSHTVIYNGNDESTKPLTRSQSRRDFLYTITTSSLVAVGTMGSPASAASSSLKTSSDRNVKTTQEGISGFVAGASVSATKTLVKYPLDSATVRLQMPNTSYAVSKPLELFNGSLRGVSLPLLSNIPGGAIFFAVKDASKSALVSAGCPKWISTCLAVAIAQPPYWLARNPSEVIKTRQQANVQGYESDVSTLDAIQNLISNITISEEQSRPQAIFDELYSGYFENMAYAYPADVIKFVCYDKLTGAKTKKITPLEGAVYGAVATSIAQFATTPLDVVRNRVMAVKTVNAEKKNLFQNLNEIAFNEGLSGLFAGASPRIGKSLLSGAIQFATYEETKTKIAQIFQPK